jgi:uncharacterized protein
MDTGASRFFQLAQIAFGTVRHTRLRPSKNAFAYPAFYMRLPVHEMKEVVRARKGLFGLNQPGVLSFYESDHGDGKGCFRWITQLLADHGISTQGPIWLLSFPRVLGYVFQPVSFWLCHRPDGRLHAVVAEVNNTFGERHVYLLSTAGGIGMGQEVSSQKSFYVSPFCEPRGTYRFRFFDQAQRSLMRVDHDDDQGPLLLTSMSGQHVSLGLKSTFKAIAAYPLFTLGVIARIHWQALRLWFKGVRLTTKPPPPAHPVTAAIK